MINLFVKRVSLLSLALAGSFVWLCAQVQAADYEWRGVGTESYQDMDSACIAGAKKWSAANKYKFISSHFQAYLTQASAQCSTTYDKGKVSTNSSYNAFKIYRSGNGCTPPKVYNLTTGACGNDLHKGEEPLSCSAGLASAIPTVFSGNPINFSTGNKFQSESDYSAGNDSLLQFVRSYNSFDALWRHNYSTSLRIAVFKSTIYVSLVMASGREIFFTVNGATVTPNSIGLGQLVRLADGWQYTSENNDRYIFDTAGRMINWSNASGYFQQFSYTGNQIIVTDNLGQSLTFTEDAEHQPLTLTGPGAQITYSYDANRRLVAVSRTLAGQTSLREFHYEDSRNNGLLTGITDERGVRYATWSYDDQGRAISSEHANGAERIAIEYKSDGGASVTNELGKVTSYQFQTILGVKRIIAIKGEPSANCPNSNSTFTYDDRGLLKTKTDNKGNLTTYDYNTRGLETSRTEAAGTSQARTIITEWHPTLFLPVTVTEPARITSYTYDAQGRRLSQSVTQR
jgi:YD repeat-containing protein